MATLIPNPTGGFSFGGIVRFEGLEQLGTDLTQAALVFRFDDGTSMRMSLPHSDLSALQSALANWLGRPPIEGEDTRTKH
jgi:hypothetical protein